MTRGSVFCKVWGEKGWNDASGKDSARGAPGSVRGLIRRRGCGCVTARGKEPWRVRRGGSDERTGEPRERNGQPPVPRTKAVTLPGAPRMRKLPCGLHRNQSQIPPQRISKHLVDTVSNQCYSLGVDTMSTKQGGEILCSKEHRKSSYRGEKKS